MKNNTAITLTDNASQYIARIIAGHKDGIGFRLSAKKTGCSGYMYNSEVVNVLQEKDIRIDTKQGITIFLDAEWLPVFKGTVIDLLDESLGRQRLVFKNPNVDDECGCGESFNLKRID